jgi:hypothetical protein
VAAAAHALDLRLPCLRLQIPDASSALAEQIERALLKFAIDTAPSAFTITASVRCEDGSGGSSAAEAIAAEANIWYQFVVGHERAEGAAYATADGSVARIDFGRSQLTLQLTSAVFDAPYSTWSDLVSAPLASAWRFHGFFPLHAAAVSSDESTVLVIGASGSGKTTTALALVEAGGAWRADDKVLVYEEAGAVSAVSLYANTNLAPVTIAAYPSLGFAMHRPSINETNEKRPCFLAELDRRVDLTPCTPTALLFVEQAPRPDSHLRRITATEALLRLSAQSPTGAERRSLKAQHQRLVTMARTVPAWRLEAGRDVLERPVAFASRLREQVASGPA